MIVVRFEMRWQPGKTERMMGLPEGSHRPSRVVSFDIAHDVADPDAFITTEVFEHRAALDRQESLPQVAKVMAI